MDNEIKTIDLPQDNQSLITAPDAGNEMGQYVRLMELVIEKGADIEFLKRLIDMQEHGEKLQAEKALNLSVSVFQGNIPPIPLNGIGHRDHRYALINDIAHGIREPLSKAGLSYRFEHGVDKVSVKVTCILTHALGCSRSTSITGPHDNSGGKNQAQAIASAISYWRRYTLTGILGITAGDIDDDTADDIYQVKPMTTEPIEDGYYPDHVFDEKLPTWRNGIESGRKTSIEVIAWLTDNSKLKLTDDQKNKLRQIKKAAK